MLRRRVPLKSKPKRREGPSVHREGHPTAREERRAASVAALLRTQGRPAVMGGWTSGKPVPKDEPVRSEEYRRLVAALPCWLCGAVGRSQAAHADRGKGMGIKADDRTCYPACGPQGNDPGCHYAIGMTGRWSREERRALEELAGRETRERIWNAGLWPKGLPRMEDA